MLISSKLLILGIIPLLIPSAYAHTVDSIADKYRIEIGWMNEPVVSGETNGIELFISPLIPCPDISEAIKCAEAQEFQNGITGLEKSLKMQLVYKTEKITLKLQPDHNIPGKYYAFVDPTVAGFYQANVLGDIEGTIVSLSMHPPKVDEREYIEFPEPADVTLDQIIEAHTSIVEDINKLKGSTRLLEEPNLLISLGHVGFGVGIAGVIIALIALNKIKKAKFVSSLGNEFKPKKPEE